MTRLWRGYSPRPVKKRILFVFPTAWDRRQLEACRHGWGDRFEPLFAEPSAEAVGYDFDVLDFIDRTAAEWRGRIDGVASSSDYPGAPVERRVKAVLIDVTTGATQIVHASLTNGKVEQVEPVDTRVQGQPAIMDDDFIAVDEIVKSDPGWVEAMAKRGLTDLDYPFHDKTVTVTTCGRICLNRKKVNLSTVFAGQKVGIKQVDDTLWLASFMTYDLGYFDEDSCRLEPIDDPFGKNLLPMSPV